MPWITHMLFLDLNYNFSWKEKEKKLRRSLIMLGFVWGRFMNYSPSLLSTRMIYVNTRTWNSGTDMAISLLHFTTFFRWEDKSIERGESHFKSGHVESFSYADGEIVGLVHDSRRENDVTYETCSLSHCVFSTAFNWAQWTVEHEKLSFKSTNNICVIRGIWWLGPENNYCLSIESHSYFTIS